MEKCSTCGNEYDKTFQVTLAREDPRADDPLRLHHATTMGISRTLRQYQIADMELLLVEVMREGRPMVELPDILHLRERRKADVERLDSGVRRIVNPHTYHVSLTDRLWRLKQELVADTTG
jgi:nicotinate phosphoribosyltransferase